MIKTLVYAPLHLVVILLLAATPSQSVRLLQEDTVPLNDVCGSEGGTVEVLEGGDVIVANTTLATPRVFACDSEETIGIYYHLFGTGSGFRISTCHNETTFNTTLIVSDYNCEDVGCGGPYYADLVVLDENDDDGGCDYEWGTTVEFWSTEGVNYTMVVRGATVDDTGVFGLSVTEYERPSNDVCHQPEELEFDDNNVAIVAMAVGSTENATRSGLNCWADIYPTVYYSVVGNGETFTASTCNSTILNFNSSIIVNDFICDPEQGETATGCSSDYSSADYDCDETGNAAIVQWETEQDVTYVIMVLGEMRDERGDFALTVQAGGNFTYGTSGGGSTSNRMYLLGAWSLLSTAFISLNW